MKVVDSENAARSLAEKEGLYYAENKQLVPVAGTLYGERTMVTWCVGTYRELRSKWLRPRLPKDHE